MIYLASPYSHQSDAIRRDRWRAACLFCAEQAKQGWVIYSPIAHWHNIAEYYKLPTDWHFWEKQCLSMLEKADELWVLCLPGWFDSKGVTAETTYWREVLNRENIALHCPSDH